MLVVEPGRGRGRDEELGPVRARTGVRHADRVRSVVLERRVELVGKVVPPQALASRAVSEWVSSLDHLDEQRARQL